MLEEKKRIRNEMKPRLASVPNRIAREEYTTERLVAYLQNALPKRPWRVAAYKSVTPEFGTDSFIERLFEQGAEVYVPVTRGERMTFVRIHPDTRFQAGAFGIPEPPDGEETAAFDAVIVPLIAFDSENRRLGHGKGYYDRFLSSSEALKIGVAFSEQKIRRVPVEAHDVPLDIVFFG